jgi:hypothetical protein
LGRRKREEMKKERTDRERTGKDREEGRRQG